MKLSKNYIVEGILLEKGSEILIEIDEIKPISSIPSLSLTLRDLPNKEKKELKNKKKVLGDDKFIKILQDAIKEESSEEDKLKTDLKSNVLKDVSEEDKSKILNYESKLILSLIDESLN